jgi:hypothetical protein
VITVGSRELSGRIGLWQDNNNNNKSVRFFDPYQSILGTDTAYY